MSDLELLIHTAEILSNRLGKAAEDERKFGIDLCLQLEKLSWEMLRTKNDLQEIVNILQ